MAMLKSSNHKIAWHKMIVPALFPVFICCACSLTVFLCLSSDEELFVERHMLQSDESYKTSLPSHGKPLTRFKEMYQQDDRSYNQRVLEYLENGYVSEFDDTSISFEIGDLFVWNVRPKFSRMFFDMDLPYDAIDFEILFTFDTGETKGTLVHAVPAGYTVRTSVELPNDAKKVRVQAFTFKKGAVLTGKTELLSDSKKFEKQSNNTIKFNCSRTRFFVCSEMNVILDDVTIGGRGTLITANGATKMIEVEVTNDT